MSIASLIESLRVARAAWEAVDPDGECEGPEWDPYEAAEAAFLRFHCATTEDVCAKVRFILDTPSTLDAVENSWLGGDRCVVIVLRSMLGGAS